MSLKSFRLKTYDTSTSTGTGAFTIDQNPAGLGGVGAGAGDQTQLTITDGAGNYEVVLVTLTISGGVMSFSRDTVVASSNGGAKVNFAAGIKTVLNYVPDSLRDLLLRLGLPTRFFF